MVLSLATFFSINTFRRFQINSAQKRLAKNNFKKKVQVKTSNTSQYRESFNSKENNLGRVEIHIVCKAIHSFFVCLFCLFVCFFVFLLLFFFFFLEGNGPSRLFHSF